MKKLLIMSMILFMIIMATSNISGEEPTLARKERKTDFVYDLIRASYFAETYVDLTMSSILSDRGHEDLNPLYNWHMGEPALSLAITQISNALIYSLTDEIFYYFQKEDKEYIAYAIVVALLAAKTYAIVHNSKAFR